MPRSVCSLRRRTDDTALVVAILFFTLRARYSLLTGGEAALLDMRGRLADRDAALREVNAALTARDQFVSVASHKLRTPLTAIKGEIQLARRYAARAAAPPTVDMHMQRQEFPPGSSPA